ncbi:MAG: hypothetical protein ACR2HJ_10280 [Fimbriimonadales bacterium]
MIRKQDILQSARVASPCHADWDEMEGDDGVRFCGHCRLHVFNLSAMSADEAARLVSERRGRLCVRYCRHKDGSVVTRDRPAGFRKARTRLAWAWGVAVASMLSAFGCANECVVIGDLPDPEVSSPPVLPATSPPR